MVQKEEEEDEEKEEKKETQWSSKAFFSVVAFWPLHTNKFKLNSFHFSAIFKTPYCSKELAFLLTNTHACTQNGNKYAHYTHIPTMGALMPTAEFKLALIGCSVA